MIAITVYSCTQTQIGSIMQSKKKEITCNILPLAPLLPFTAHTTPPWRKANSFLKIKSGPRLTITPSPLQQHSLRVCGTENPAAVILLISQAEAAVPVCFISLWILASHVWLDKCRVELPGHMCSVWVFALEPVPLGISGGDWLVPFVIRKDFKVQVQ